VYRKAPRFNVDTPGGLAGSGDLYVDSTVVVGTPYEYQVVKARRNTRYGYIYSGHQPAKDR